MAKRPTKNARIKGQELNEQGKVSRFKCLCYQNIRIREKIIRSAKAGGKDSTINANKCIPIILLNFLV